MYSYKNDFNGVQIFPSNLLVFLTRLLPFELGKWSRMLWVRALNLNIFENVRFKKLLTHLQISFDKLDFNSLISIIMFSIRFWYSELSFDIFIPSSCEKLFHWGRFALDRYSRFDQFTKNFLVLFVWIFQNPKINKCSINLIENVRVSTKPRFLPTLSWDFSRNFPM